MLQLNLLPDVKIEYIKTQRTKRLVFGTALIAMLAAGTVTLLLALVVYGVQKKNMNDLSSDVQKYSGQLKQTPDLNKILTIQDQLGALTGLHDQKVIASRVFLLAQQATPQGVTVSDFTTDFQANTISISGAASALDRVNTFTDTLKYANFDAGVGKTIHPFSNIVLSQFGRSENATTYTIALSFDPTVFSVKSTYNLIVPKQNTTDSVTGQPAEIFKQTAPSGSGQ